MNRTLPLAEIARRRCIVLGVAASFQKPIDQLTEAARRLRADPGTAAERMDAARLIHQLAVEIRCALAPHGAVNPSHRAQLAEIGAVEKEMLAIL